MRMRERCTCHAEIELYWDAAPRDEETVNRELRTFRERHAKCVRPEAKFAGLVPLMSDKLVGEPS